MGCTHKTPCKATEPRVYYGFIVERIWVISLTAEHDSRSSWAPWCIGVIFVVHVIEVFDSMDPLLFINGDAPFHRSDLTSRYE